MNFAKLLIAGIGFGAVVGIVAALAEGPNPDVFQTASETYDYYDTATPDYGTADFYPTKKSGTYYDDDKASYQDFSVPNSGNLSTEEKTGYDGRFDDSSYGYADLTPTKPVYDYTYTPDQ